MPLDCCSALKRVFLIGLAALLLAISGGEARAGGLSVVVRVQQDFYQPLVPVTKNFRTCFQTDSSGAQVMGICTTPSEGERVPASPPQPPPPKAQKQPE